MSKRIRNDRHNDRQTEYHNPCACAEAIGIVNSSFNMCLKMNEGSEFRVQVQFPIVIFSTHNDYSRTYL